MADKKKGDKKAEKPADTKAEKTVEKKAAEAKPAAKPVETKAKPVESKPKAAEPKAAEKPKAAEQPKAAEKPKAAEQPKAAPKAAEQPKAAAAAPAPKAAAVAPAPKAAAAAAPAPKAAEPKAAAAAAKPAEKKEAKSEDKKKGKKLGAKKDLTKRTIKKIHAQVFGRKPAKEGDKKAEEVAVKKGERKGRVKHNYLIAPGVYRYSKSQMFRRRGVQFLKNKTRIPRTKKVIHKCPRFYPADKKPHPLESGKKKTQKPQKLRSSITPGTILIVLAGRFRGRRVVFLKQLKSGLLLVTGPYKVNGVPLRRINQAYVIATTTKIGDISDIDVSAVDDGLWKRKHNKRDHHKKRTEKAFYAEYKHKQRQAKKESLEKFKALQKTVDAGLVKKISTTPLLRAYLESHFSLTNGQFPHALKF